QSVRFDELRALPCLCNRATVIDWREVIRRVRDCVIDVCWLSSPFLGSGVRLLHALPPAGVACARAANGPFPDAARWLLPLSSGTPSQRSHLPLPLPSAD